MNVTCTTAANASAATGVTAAARRPRMRRCASPGSAPSSSRASTPVQPGASRSGIPRSAVEIALAWISGPDISWSLAVGVAWTSWSVGALAPITTMRLRSFSGSTRPLTRSEKWYVGTVPRGPA